MFNRRSLVPSILVYVWNVLFIMLNDETAKNVFIEGSKHKLRGLITTDN